MNRHALKAFISYAHQDEDHHRRLSAHLAKLKDEGLIESWESWDDRDIKPGKHWDEEIKNNLKQARLIILMVSRAFLDSEYIRQEEIPLALEQHKQGQADIVCVILDECDWKRHFASYQVLPPSAAPMNRWPDLDSAYAVVASGIAATARELLEGIARIAREERQRRRRTIFSHTPFRIVGENYDPFHAFNHVFRRRHMYSEDAIPFPLNLADDAQVEFLAWDYQTIFATVRDSTHPPGLSCDLFAIPYFLLGHCVERGLLQPLADRLKSNEVRFAWWDETCVYEGTLYGVPLSSLTMLLAVRTDLFERYGLTAPDSWIDYVALIDDAIARDLPIAPAALQGSDHITLWYDWLNHLYAHDANDLVLYGGSRLHAREAAESLREGTVSYLTMAAKLAPYADGNGALPHWATMTWDDAIHAFAQGQLLTHMIFNDALDTLRRRMEIGQDAQASGQRVGYLPVPRSLRSGRRNGHVESWILCIPNGSRYYEAANDVLEWFLQPSIQRAYSVWGGASGESALMEQPGLAGTDGGAAVSFKASVEDSQTGGTGVDLVKHKGPRALEVIDRMRANLYDAVLAVAARRQPPAAAADVLVRRVAQRLSSRMG